MSDIIEIDALIAQIASRVRMPGHANTNGPPFDLPPHPVSATTLRMEEAVLGQALPSLLERLYTEVGNGGFGPGHGLLSIASMSSHDRPISYFYGPFRATRNQSGADWPNGIVPFNDWGDLILSCIDIRSLSNDPPVVRFEPNMSRSETHHFVNSRSFCGVGMIPECSSLSSWFTRWLDSEEMFERPYQRL